MVGVDNRQAVKHIVVCDVVDRVSDVLDMSIAWLVSRIVLCVL